MPWYALVAPISASSVRLGDSLANTSCNTMGVTTTVGGQALVHLLRFGQVFASSGLSSRPPLLRASDRPSEPTTWDMVSLFGSPDASGKDLLWCSNRHHRCP